MIAPSLIDIAGILALASVGVVVSINVERVLPTVRKVGGLWHWRIGRVGGSFYMSKKGTK